MAGEIIVHQKAAMTEEEFLAFVEAEIEKLKKHVEFEAQSDVGFYDLQEKLKEYTPVHLTLIHLQAKYRFQANRLEQSFQSWFDSKFIEVRSEFNRIEISAQKWMAQKELEAIVRVRFADEYVSRKEDVDGVKQRESFINSLIRIWESHSYILSNMSNNVQSEVGTLGLGGNLRH